MSPAIESPRAVSHTTVSIPLETINSGLRHPAQANRHSATDHRGDVVVSAYTANPDTIATSSDDSVASYATASAEESCFRKARMAYEFAGNFLTSESNRLQTRTFLTCLQIVKGTATHAGSDIALALSGLQPGSVKSFSDEERNRLLGYSHGLDGLDGAMALRAISIGGLEPFTVGDLKQFSAQLEKLEDMHLALATDGLTYADTARLINYLASMQQYEFIKKIADVQVYSDSDILKYLTRNLWRYRPEHRSFRTNAIFHALEILVKNNLIKTQTFEAISPLSDASSRPSPGSDAEAE